MVRVSGARPGVDVAMEKHIAESLLEPLIVAAAGMPGWRVLPSSKQHVPPHDVAIVVAMALVFVVDACISGRWKMKPIQRGVRTLV